MPTIATSPHLHPSTNAAPSVTLRLQVASRRAALTRQLAEGENPSDTAQLTLRARQLTTARCRSALAGALRRAVREAQHPSLHRAFSIVSRRSVLSAVEEIDLLVKRLHSPEPVTPQGMALVAELLTDGASSPLYGSADPSVLRRLVTLHTAALDPAHREAPPFGLQTNCAAAWPDAHAH
jgi:hypothetical protein